MRQPNCTLEGVMSQVYCCPFLALRQLATLAEGPYKISRGGPTPYSYPILNHA